MSFFLLSAKTIDAYFGLGMGCAGLKRCFLAMEKNEHDGQKTIEPETSAHWAHSFAVRMIFGATYTFYSKYFTGIEGYVGHQFLDNIFLKASTFGGGRALIGMYLPYEMKIQLGLGVDVGHHVSKRVRNEVTCAVRDANDILPPFLEYTHVAPCMNFMWTKNNGNISIRADIEIIFPKTTKTSTSVCYTSIPNAETIREPLSISHTTGGKIDYRSIQWRMVFSIIWNHPLPLPFLK